MEGGYSESTSYPDLGGYAWVLREETHQIQKTLSGGVGQ